MDGKKQRQNLSQWVQGGISGILVLGLAMSTPVCAADVFVSFGLEGSQRYATQALDSSYRLVYREAPPPAPSASATRERTGLKGQHLRAIIDGAAFRHGVSRALVEAVVQVESNLDPAAESPKGARGAMQLMPATAARYGLTGPHSWRDPERNIDAGVRHLKDLLSQHQGNIALALAAYNAGAGAVGRHHNRIPPYRETMLYVPAVLAKAASISAP